MQSVVHKPVVAVNKKVKKIRRINVNWSERVACWLAKDDSTLALMLAYGIFTCCSVMITVAMIRLL